MAKTLAGKSMAVSPRHAAAQLAEALAAELPRSRAKPVRLPSRRQVADRFGVSLPTVTVALRELQRRRLVYWVPGKGMFCGGHNAGRPRLLTVGLLGWFSHVRADAGVGVDAYRMHLMHDLMSHAVTHGCQITVIPHETDSPVDLTNLRHSNLDALLLKDVGLPQRDIAELRKLGLPLLSDSMKFLEQGVGYVGYDNLAMMRDIVEIFSSRVHRRIAYIGVETSSPNQNTLMRQTFFTALVDAGLIYDFNAYWQVCPWAEWRRAHNEQFLFDHATRAARDLLSRHGADRPTAIFAWQPQLASAVLKVAGEAGLRVPHDVSIITDAIDDSATECSTFVQPHSELARRLIERVLEVIEDPDRRVRDDVRKAFLDKGTIRTLI